MNIFFAIYNEIFYRPLFNGLIFIYNFLPVHDLGLSIIILTVFLRLAISPLSRKAIKSQRALADLQPHINEIQRIHKDNKEEQAKKMMALYAEKNINPFSGCLPILIQFPVLIALYQVFGSGLGTGDFSFLYPFIKNPGTLNTISLGFLNLSRPNIFLGILAGLTQFFQAGLMPVQATAGSGKTGSSDFSRAMQWQTKYFLPSLVIIWSIKLPAALPLYWTILNIFGIIEYSNIAQIWNRLKKK